MAFSDQSGACDAPRRVLIVRTGAMGDVLHAMPAVAALRLRHPGWMIGWAIEPRWLPLLRAEADVAGDVARARPLVDRVHTAPTGAWNRRPFSRATAMEIAALRRDLREEHYDVCVDMQGLLRSAVIGRFARAGEFVGLAKPREPFARLLYGRTVETRAAHVIDRGCELLGDAVGEELVAAPVLLPRDGAAERWAEEVLAGLPGRVVLLAPTAGWGAKQWPVERYGAAAAVLAEAGCTVLVNAVREGDLFAAAVTGASGGLARAVPCTMPQLIALLRRVSLMIAGDTGPLHLAAALRRPVVALFGPTDPPRTGPYGTRSEVIRHETSRVDHRRHAEPEAGLTRITVEEVVGAALRLLEG